MNRPYDRLRRIASRICNESTMTKVIEPILADLQWEDTHAPFKGPWRRRIVRVRARLAFWAALTLFLWNKVHLPGRILGRRAWSALSEINVVPLVGVVLVLLITVMVTVPMLRFGINVNRRVTTRTNQTTGERVVVTIPASYQSDNRMYLGDEPLPAEVLQERVRQALEDRTDKNVYLRGDRALYYREWIDIIDRLKAAGVKNVGLEMQPSQPR